jgi:hypothetical protein
MFFVILIAILLGAWAGIAFDAWTLDKWVDNDTGPFGMYAREPWRTITRTWDIITGND